jgi:hypothetical protein
MQCPKCNYVRKPSDINPDWECPSCGIAYSKFKKKEKYVTRYIPNIVPRSERLIYLVLSLLLVCGGASGLSNDDLIMVTKRHIYHLHGKEAAIMYGAYIFASLCMVTIIADHYDRRDNEAVYWFLSRFFGVIAVIVMFCSLLAR